MPIENIQPTQSQPSSLLQILQGGSQHIAGILDRAIQIGRDMSNKRTQQEQDMIAMRQQETNLAQRRAENLQQDIEDAQKFARGAYEFDTRMGVEQQRTAAIQDRARVSDLLQQQNSDRNYALAARRLGMTEAEYRRRAALNAGVIGGLRESVYGTPEAGTAPNEASAPSTVQGARVGPQSLYATGSSMPSAYAEPAPVSSSTAAGVIPPGQETPSWVPPELATRDGVAPPVSSLLTPAPVPPAAPTASVKPPDIVARRAELKAQIDTLKQRVSDAKELAKSGDARARGVIPKLVQQKARLEEEHDSLKAPTPVDPEVAVNRKATAERAARDQQIQEETVKQKKLKTEAEDLVRDVSTFVRPIDSYTKSGMYDPTTKIFRKDVTPEMLTEMALYEKDPPAMELSYARNYSTPEAFVKALGGKLSPAQVKKRKRLWEIAQEIYATGDAATPATSATPAATTTAAPASSSAANDWVRKRAATLR